MALPFSVHPRSKTTHLRVASGPSEAGGFAVQAMEKVNGVQTTEEMVMK